ncbi:MAG: hypothetical protein FJX67_05225 [Alphaproteobacteria bacterium]|nr:hypothetical protein [Alphaproteobacteria bacterium]
MNATTHQPDLSRIGRPRLPRLGALAGGWLLLLAATAFVAEIAAAVMSGMYRAFAAGEVWYALDQNSLNVAQAVIQRNVHPAIWDTLADTVLLASAWAVLGTVGLAVVAASLLRTR